MRSDPVHQTRRVVLTEVTTRAEAALVVGYLEANGVPAASSADDIGGAYPGVGRIRVLVDEVDLDLATRLLEQTHG